MVSRSGVSSFFLAAALASAAAGAQSDGKTRAIIQGTGRDVSIVYRAPLASVPSAEGSHAADPLAEAIRRKKGGADDAAVIAYLRQNQAELPDVVDAGVIRLLRRAGAGDSVITELSRLAAVDVGRTAGDAAVPAAQPQEESSAYAGAYPDLAGMGYPFYGGGGYGGGFSGGGWFGGRVNHHGSKGFLKRPVFLFKQPFFRFKQPFFPNARHLQFTRIGPTPRRMR